MNTEITIVTGLWDLDRGNLDSWAKRDFEQYKERFFEMLETDAQMCVWIPSELKHDVERIRGNKPTKIFIKEVSDFESWNPFFSKIQEIRQSENWLSQAEWLRGSPQAALKSYNPMMFTKMFMLNDSALVNPFNSKYFYWIDGGLTSTVNRGYFQKDLVLDNLGNFMSQKDITYLHLAYPYEGNTEIHGFERNAMAKYCNTDYVRYVCRGGFFGGEKDVIHQLNSIYYSIMETTLKSGFMGADECFFTILTHTYPDLIYKYDIEGNGLVWPFFEELKKYDKKFVKTIKKSKNNNYDVGLYVITFNSPKQFETLIKSMLEYDPNFIYKTNKFLLDNSTDLSTTPKYKRLCDEYGFEYIKKNNIGITGGRVFIAEHFNEQEDLLYYFFYEDDMLFYNGKDITCKNGFVRKIDNLFDKSIEIIKKENFDYLKLNFTEFYGAHNKQWSWYNVPQDFREKHWPSNQTLPKQGLDPYSPNLEFKNIQSHKGLAYASGEIYLSNWPILMSREGNYNCYLKTKFQYPYEQTVMSNCYQETIKGNIKPGLLLSTPTEHNRFEFYDGSLRKEC
jgi:hypothetical protein